MNKKSYKHILVAALLCMGANQAVKAQSLTSVLKNVATAAVSNSSTASTITSTIANLIGTSTVSESSVKGTWKYSEPAVAFESEDLLTSVAGTAVAPKVEKKMLNAMTKVGFKKGKSTVTFNSDNTFTCSYGSTTGNGTYSISGSNITLTSSITGASVTGNVKLSDNTLQITFTASKLLKFMNTLADKTSTSTTTQIATVTSLVKNVKGIQIGMKFTK
jgi:hypothetical protein